jgi:hypothetical protein
MIQESIGTTSFANWSNALESIGILALLYCGRGYNRMQKEMTEWRVFLFGINNDNGINGNVKLLMQEREDRLKAGVHVHHRERDV